MSELTREEKLKIFEKLPKKLQDLMGSEDTGAFLLYLRGKYNLPDEKVHLLSKMVGDVILGLLPLPNLVSEISTKIAVDQNIASQIAQEINSELFAPVANLLKGALAQITTQYRKPLVVSRVEPSLGPEVVDLRKAPPLTQVPVAAAPIPPMVSKVEPPKPVPPPLIEAEPHKTEATADKYREEINVLDLRQDKGEF